MAKKGRIEEELEKINAEMGTMKDNELRHIRLHPGSGGMITVKKGPKPGNPLAELNNIQKSKSKLIMNDADKAEGYDFGNKKFKSKVIRQRGVAPARYD